MRPARGLGEAHRPVERRFCRVRIDGGQRLRAKGLGIESGRGRSRKRRCGLLGGFSTAPQPYDNEKHRPARESPSWPPSEAQATTLSQRTARQQSGGNSGCCGTRLELEREVKEVMEHQSEQSARCCALERGGILPHRPECRPDGERKEPKGDG
jgi:hypothetical protein